MIRRIICGSRHTKDRDLVWPILDGLGEFFLIVGYDPNDPRHQGVDQLAYEWAKSRGVKGVCVPAKWKAQGKAAGPIRNRKMLTHCPDEVCAFPGGRGTDDMKRAALEAGVPVVELSPHAP